MTRPPLEVADLIRAAGTAFFARSRKWFTWLHLKILTAIVSCRTSALGGHIDACSRCGNRAISFNSCRNRHCPKCQSNARDRWLDARRRELLPVPYAHVVFTLPHQLAPLALQNKSEIYGLLFRASAETLPRAGRAERDLRLVVPARRGDAADGGSRRETPRGGHRLLQRAAYLEPETAAPSACPLRGSGRRTVARSHSVDCGAVRVLPAGARSQSGVSGKVRGRFAGTARGRKTRFSRRLGRFGRTGRIRGHAARTVLFRLGGLRHTSLRRG